MKPRDVLSSGPRKTGLHVCLGQVRVVVSLGECEVDDGVVRADKLDERFAERCVEHHVVPRSLATGTVRAIVVSGQRKGVLWKELSA